MTDLFGTEELEIKIKVITVDGKKMSKSLFFQLKENDILKGEEIKETGEKIEIEIDDNSYIIFDEENGYIYSINSNGNPGKIVGKLVNGEPEFE